MIVEIDSNGNFWSDTILWKTPLAVFSFASRSNLPLFSILYHRAFQYTVKLLGLQQPIHMLSSSIMVYLVELDVAPPPKLAHTINHCISRSRAWIMLKIHLGNKKTNRPTTLQRKSFKAIYFRTPPLHLDLISDFSMLRYHHFWLIWGLIACPRK